MNNTIESSESVGLNSKVLERIKPVMQSYVDEKRFAGFSTMIARRGRIVHFEQVGYRETESKKPITPDTIFRIYSMTKPIICTALMILFEEGRFQLIDPVAKFIPAFGEIKVLTGEVATGCKEVDLIRPVTIRDLLTHTAGLSYHFLEDSPVCGMYRQANFMRPGLSLQALVNELAEMPLAYQPGTRFHYSMGIDVAAHLIEIISDQPLIDFLKARLFEPLGMIDTDFCVPPEKGDRLAAMYGLPDISLPDTTFSTMLEAWQSGNIGKINVLENYTPDYPFGFARGGHGLYSTAWDYMQFAQMLLNGGNLNGVRILGYKIVELMHMNHMPVNLLPFEIGGIPILGYGFGLGSRVLMNVAESAMPGSVGEFGWSGAAKTYYWVDSREEIIGILMTQYMMGVDLPEKDFQVLAYAALMN